MSHIINFNIEKTNHLTYVKYIYCYIYIVILPKNKTPVLRITIDKVYFPTLIPVCIQGIKIIYIDELYFIGNGNSKLFSIFNKIK